MDKINQPVKIGNQLFPGVWRFMLPKDLMKLPIPREHESPCSNCPKMATDDFRPDYRCCTYQPRVPNFLIGLGILSSDKIESLMQAQLDQGGMTPEGFVQTPHQWALYLEDLELDRFGKSEQVLCPFLDTDNGYCGIYAFRNGVCSTFFCRGTHQKAGDKFWQDLLSLVNQCELAIGQWVMGELGIDPKQYAKMLDKLAPGIKGIACPDSKNWNHKVLDKLWGPWRGRELEFFRECGRLVSENRDSLWELSGGQEIYDCLKFDKASVKVVPKAYRCQIEDDHATEGVTVPPQELWTSTLRSHSKLFTIPGGPLGIDRDRVGISSNRGECPEGRQFTALTRKVIRHKKAKPKQEVARYFVSDTTVEALSLFDSPRIVDHSLLESIAETTGLDPVEFLSEWVHKKVIRPTYSLSH